VVFLIENIHYKQDSMLLVGAKFVQSLCWRADERSFGWNSSSVVDWLDELHETQ